MESYRVKRVRWAEKNFDSHVRRCVQEERESAGVSDEICGSVEQRKVMNMNVGKSSTVNVVI